MKIRLSHSAITMFQRCAAQYENHYIKRLRSEKLGSPLLFGNAIDEALNVVLLSKKPKLTKEEEKQKTLDPISVFNHQMTYRVMKTEVGIEDIKTSPQIEYYRKDFNETLLFDEDLDKLRVFIKNAGYEETDPVVLFNVLYEKIKEGTGQLTDVCFCNYASWLSLCRKGHLMIETYKEQILPQIKKVHSIQRKVILPNDNDDEIIGYIDFEAEFVNKEGIFTIDNKTSGRKYKEADINENGQLLLYDEFTGNGQASYIVLLKEPKVIKYRTCVRCNLETTTREHSCKAVVNKTRCRGSFGDIVEIENQIVYQILTGVIDEKKKDLLFDKIGDTLDKIENKQFKQNRDECFQFGRKCVYYDYCRSGNLTGLSKKG